MPDNQQTIIDQLERDIADQVGTKNEDELDSISASFNKSLIDALRSFNSTSFDDDGFIKKMSDLQLEDKQDKETVKNVLNNIRSDYLNADTMNQTELLMRRDIHNIVTQMPEMHDVINIIRDSIIECNVATGEVSRSIVFQNHEDENELETQVKELELQHELLMAIKNFIVPRTLEHGEMYCQVVPYAKLFAELEIASDKQTGRSSKKSAFGEAFKRSIPKEVSSYFKEGKSLYSEANVKTLMESVDRMAGVDSLTERRIETGKESGLINETKVNSEVLGNILKNIHVYNGSSVLYSESGIEGLRYTLNREYRDHKVGFSNRDAAFMEAQLDYSRNNNSIFAGIDQDLVDFSNYSDIKGCYVKYLDGLRMIPIRMDRRVIGYYYVSTTLDLQTSNANPNGLIDLSYQNYTRDKNLVDQLSDIIIRSFDKQMLQKNIKLKSEIAEVIMAHKFSEGQLSFIYIPENEVVRIVINEDEEGRGHSVLEPTLFPSRIYVMLTLYNLLFTLNNNTTRVHYLKSSGLNKDYAAQIQRTMRKFQQRRITIDDIYSYSGVLNKIGGMGEMILPAGRNDFKALETDTIEPVANPFSIEFLEQQRREAISGTGVPNLLVMNAIDEVDFAKTLEMANSRFLSTVGSYKIDFNRGITRLYQAILKASTDMDIEVIQSFRFQFNMAKQQELQINADMIQNFNSLVEVVESLYFSKEELEKDSGAPTPKRMHLRRELAREYLPQLDFDLLEDVVKRVELDSGEDEAKAKVANLQISSNDLEQVES